MYYGNNNMAVHQAEISMDKYWWSSLRKHLEQHELAHWEPTSAISYEVGFCNR